jgi:hypothetical protein
MSYLEDFEQWKDEIEAVPLNEVKPPNIPVDDFVARTETLAVNANEDREALVAAGLDGTLIDDLPPLSGALRYCQAQWMSIFRAREDAKIEWDKQSPAAFALRNNLLHHFSFGFRDNDNLLKKVMRIREGASRADMVQDLIELAVLGENNPDALNEINFDLDLLPQARVLSHSMSELLAGANGADGDGNETKKLRDKAFTLLAQKDSTIREYGRYVFWKDDNKRDKYIK